MSDRKYWLLSVGLPVGLGLCIGLLIPFPGKIVSSAYADGGSPPLLKLQANARWDRYPDTGLRTEDGGEQLVLTEQGDWPNTSDRQEWKPVVKSLPLGKAGYIDASWIMTRLENEKMIYYVNAEAPILREEEFAHDRKVVYVSHTRNRLDKFDDMPNGLYLYVRPLLQTGYKWTPKKFFLDRTWIRAMGTYELSGKK